MENVTLEILEGLSLVRVLMSFKVRVFAGDFEFWIGVNEYW